MKSSMLKYKWMCIAVFCCAMFTACETSPDELSYKNPISFGDRKNIGDAVNALLWGYYGDTWIYGTKTTTDNVTSVTGQNANVTIVDGDVSTLTPKDVATRYWAQTDVKYNFYAMWPLENDHGISNIKFNTNKTITFDCDITKQTDICIAATLNQTSQWYVLPANLQPVNLHFQHMLSKVQFYGFSSTAGIEAQLTNFTIRVPKSADAVCTWTTKTDENALAINYPFVDSDENAENGVDSTFLSSTLSDGQDCFSLNEQNENTNPNGTQVLEKLVLPMSGGQFHVAATYKIGNETKIVETDIEATWLPGKNYIYKFYIQPAGPIIFADEVSVIEWEDDSANSYDIPFDTAP